MENEAVVPAPAEAAGDDVAVERPMKGDDDGGMVEESTEADTGAAVDGSKDASEEGGTAQSDPQQAPQRQESSSGSGGGSAPQPTGSVGPSPLTTPFVAPSSYLRPLSSRPGTGGAGGQSGDLSRGQETPPPPPSRSGGVGMRKASLPIDREQMEGLRAIRAFLKVRTSYDVLPLSYRLIVFDTALLVKKSLNILIQCDDGDPGIVSAPLWDSKSSTFGGLLTVSDYLNVIQYYWQNPDALHQIGKFQLSSLRDIERAIGVQPIETMSIHPLRPLYEACTRMLASHARRIPLVDIDDETEREMVVSVVTQYRILKFISVNVKETQMLRKPLRDIPSMGTYTHLATATMDTPVMDCIHTLVQRSISTIPILDTTDGTVLNVFEAVDVIFLIKGGDYDSLQLTVGKALAMRADDFPGIYTCTLNDRLDTIYDTIRKSRVHRLVVVDEAKQLKGTLSLSDILEYTLNSPLGDEGDGGEDDGGGGGGS